MSFTQGWFENLALKNFDTLKQLININKPINFLEIGCFEGNCHKYMYDNILLNSNSKSTVIDPFEKSLTHKGINVHNMFTNNLSKHLDKITIYKGFSDDVLPSLEKKSYDIIYIDGDHSSSAVYNDAVNSYPLLKSGGIIIFDDYLWVGTTHQSGSTNYIIGGVDNPCRGVNNFFKEYENKVKLMDGFSPKCDIIDIFRLYSDDNYRANYTKNYNYQFFCTKI